MGAEEYETSGGSEKASLVGASFSATEAPEQAGIRAVSVATTSDLHFPDNSAFARANERETSRVFRSNPVRSKRHSTLQRGPSHGLSAFKTVILTAAVAVLHFLNVYFQRCLAPYQSTSSPTVSFSGSPVQERPSSVPLASRRSLGLHNVGSTHSRRLSEGTDTPSDPMCGDNDAGNGGIEQGGYTIDTEKNNPQGDPPRRSKRLLAIAKASEEEKDDGPTKKQRRRARRAEAQPEAGEEEEDAVEQPEDSDVAAQVSGPALVATNGLPAFLRNEPLERFQKVYQPHLKTLHFSTDAELDAALQLLLNQLKSDRKLLLQVLARSQNNPSYRRLAVALRHMTTLAFTMLQSNYVLLSHKAHPLMNQTTSKTAYKVWQFIRASRQATLEAVDKLKGIATPRGGLIDVLEILACRVFSRDILKAHAENPRLSGLAAIKETDSRLRTRPNDRTVVKALLQWLKEQPEKRHELVVPGGWLDSALSVDWDESLGPVPPEVHRTITDPRTRHAIPVVDFNPVFPFISPFINADMIRTEQDLRAWNAARDSAALTMNHALNGGALAYIHATDTGTPGEILLQDLVRSDFLLACNRFVLSEHESSQQGDEGRGQTGRPGAPAGTHEEAKKSVRTPTGDLESLSSIMWESVGVYGARSVELRAAFLAAVLKVLGDDMKKAGAGNEQLQPTERLTQSHDALAALLPRISLHTVLLKLLQQRPALLEHISPHSDLLASATYVYETGAAAFDDTEESVDGGGNGDDDGAGGAGQPELHRRSSSGMRLVRQLADTASKSRADALDFVENQSDIFFRKLRLNLYDACAQVNTENAQFSKVAAVLKEAAFIRLVSLYFSALSNALAHVPQDVKAFPEFLRESYRANVAATLSLIVVSNSPPAAAHMDRLVWGIIEQTAAANHEMISRTFENKHGSFEERQWLWFNALRFQLSDTITPSTMEQWFQAHPEAQKSLSRRSALVFRLPSLHDLREGDTPVIPELETTPPPYQTVLLYGTSDFSEPAECIAPFCQETDLPPADHNLLESWTRDITHGIKHSLRALNEVAVRDVFDVKVLTEHLCRLLLFDLTLIRLQYLTRDRPELLTTSGPVQQAFAQLRYSSAAQWEALGVFGPLSAEIRQHLLRFLMPPDDLAMQKACDATLADTVAERIQAQRRALNARWKRIPLLPVLKTWLQEHPELLSSPYLSSTSPLLIALQRLPSRRALGLSGARDVTATASDHSTSVQTATDLAVQDDRGDAASAPTVDLKGDDEEVDDGAAVDEAPTVDAAVESYPSEAPEEIQTGSPAATPESPPEHDDSLSADGVDDETSDSGRRSADLQAAEALLSLGSAPIVWRSDENEAAVTGAADPDPQGQVTEGHDAYQKAMAGAPGEPHGALHIEGESSDEDLPLDLSHKTGHAHESPGSSGTRGSASQFLHEPGDDSDFSEGRHPLGISLTTRHMYQSDATLDASSGAGYFADESDDDDTLSGEELPLDLSVRTGQAGPSSGQSDTGGEGAGEFAHASDNDDIISDVDQPLDLSAKSRGKPSDSEDEQPMDLSG